MIILYHVIVHATMLRHVRLHTCSQPARGPFARALEGSATLPDDLVAAQVYSNSDDSSDDTTTSTSTTSATTTNIVLIIIIMIVVVVVVSSQ